MFGTTQSAANSAAQKQELVAEDTSFLNEYAGEGIDALASESTSAYIGMVQSGSAFVSDENPVGTWRNSATGRNYGNNLRMIPLAFSTVWNERTSEPPYNTVANYAPNSIEVDVKQPPKGQRGFPKMYNKESGNEIKELYVYACILPDYPEDGLVYFSPAVTSMRTCKQWNSQLKGQLLPNGVQAPIFAYSWYLFLDQIANPKQPSNKITVLSRVAKDAIVDKDLFTKAVHPQLQAAKQSVLRIGEDIQQDEEA